eukprot:GHVP01059469.1.p1 GENE.GHVP01059469.1~~GHVP01059469.1.p1  ORF type:complete len:392 (-),score=67.43 GHVP01059469.1:287-1462(-)
MKTNEMKKMEYLEKKVLFEIDEEIFNKLEEVLEAKEELRKAKEIQKLVRNGYITEGELVALKEHLDSISEKSNQQNEDDSSLKCKTPAKRTKTTSVAVRSSKFTDSSKKVVDKEITKLDICHEIYKIQEDMSKKYKWTVFIKNIPRNADQLIVSIFENGKSAIKHIINAPPFHISHETETPSLIKFEVLEKDKLIFSQYYKIDRKPEKIDIEATKILKEVENPTESLITEIKCKYCGFSHFLDNITEEKCLHYIPKVSTASNKIDPRLSLKNLPRTQYIGFDEVIPVPESDRTEELFAVDSIMRILYSNRTECISNTTETLLESTKVFIEDLVSSAINTILDKRNFRDDKYIILTPAHIYNYLLKCIKKPEKSRYFLGHRFDFLTNSFTKH